MVLRIIISVSYTHLFLYMSVRNACLDYLRHQKVQRRNEPELILWLTEEGEEEFVLEEEVHAMVYLSLIHI